MFATDPSTLGGLPLHRAASDFGRELNDRRVLEEARADEAWHREEDRRMRRDAGEDI